MTRFTRLAGLFFAVAIAVAVVFAVQLAAQFNPLRTRLGPLWWMPENVSGLLPPS